MTGISLARHEILDARVPRIQPARDEPDRDVAVCDDADQSLAFVNHRQRAAIALVHQARGPLGGVARVNGCDSARHHVRRAGIGPLPGPMACSLTFSSDSSEGFANAATATTALAAITALVPLVLKLIKSPAPFRSFITQPRHHFIAGAFDKAALAV